MTRFGWTAALLLVVAPLLVTAEDDAGFEPIFDGKTLKGWDGDPKFWTVEDGAITGRTTKDNPTKGNTFIIWDGELADFELRLDYKIVGGNSGIQYRSFRLKNAADKWRIGGYQADIDSGETYSGIVYGERARGILVGRGENGRIGPDGKKSAERFAPSAEIQAKIKNEEWNSYRIVAKGNHLWQYINGVLTAELVDEDAEGEGKRMAKGLLALQLHQGPPMVVQFKNVELKRLDEKEAAGLRIQMDAKGKLAIDGKAIEDLDKALQQFAKNIRDRGVVIEAHPDVQHGDVVEVIDKCQKAGFEKFSLRVTKEGLSVETSDARFDLNADGSLSARKGRVGIDVADGTVRLKFAGFTVARFGEGAKPLGPAEVPQPALGAEGDLESISIESDVIELTIDAKGNVSVAGEAATNDEAIVDQLAEQIRTTGGAELDVFAADTLSGAEVARVINLCSKAGIQRITMKAFVLAKAEPRRVVFVAGTRSHGYGSHEHKAGCMLLAKHLEASGLPIETEVVTDGWPKDTSVFDGADCIVVYADGGGRHPFNAHLDELNKLTAKGVGIVCIHYGVEVPKGPSGEAFLEWTGGYFETHWSVNPHWEADFEKMPKHPTTRGVKPFKVNDEWYYHMRFREEGVTPILSDLPPESTLKRKDGPHSGNPAVRKAVLEDKLAQHVAWAREREDGGRGFGITGGHFHWNWGNDQMRKLMLNAIAWSAKAEVPEEGVPTKRVTVEDLMANQDYDPPGNFNPARIEAMLKQWNAE